MLQKFPANNFEWTENMHDKDSMKNYNEYSNTGHILKLFLKI